MRRATVFAGVVLVAVIGAGSVALADQAPAASQASAPNAATGQALYMKHTCYFCHGTVGQGAGPTGTQVGPPSRAVAGVIAFVRRPAGGMPSFGEKILSDAELADIYAYLRTVPRAKPADEIPLLRMLKPQ